MSRLRGVIAALPRAALTVCLLAFANAVIWGLVTPIWQGPDEWAHVAYVQSLAERGVAPDRDNTSERASISSEERTALGGTAAATLYGQAEAKPVWDPLFERQWQRADRNHALARSDGGGYTTIAAHPYLYYLLQVPVYTAASRASILTRVQLMRVTSALFIALATLFSWLFIREFFGGHQQLATFGALCVGFQPMMGFMGGAVNNDSLAVFFGALTLYLLIRLMHKATFRSGLTVGLAIGLGILAKGNLIAFAPVALLALLVAALRHRRALGPVLRAGLGLVAGSTVMGLAWILLQALVGGSVNGGGPSVGSTQLGEGIDLSVFTNYVWNFYLPPIGPIDTTITGIPGEKPVFTLWVVRFFADFGWLDVTLTAAIYKVVQWSLLGLVIAALVVSVREFSALRRRLGELLVCLAAVASVAVLVHALYYPGYLGQMAEQGRYLLPIVPVFGALVALSCRVLGSRAAPIVGTLLVSAMLALNAESLLVTTLRYYT